MKNINDNFISRFKLFYRLLSNLNSDRGIEFLKKGNKIYIKKKNRGSFTKYCEGNVTDECILQGKNSPDPAIRKKATFAANARKWKHADGGVIHNPIVKMISGSSKYIMGFNEDGTTRFAYTDHDLNPTTGVLELPEIVVTP